MRTGNSEKAAAANGIGVKAAIEMQEKVEIAIAIGVKLVIVISKGVIETGSKARTESGAVVGTAIKTGVNLATVILKTVTVLGLAGAIEIGAREWSAIAVLVMDIVANMGMKVVGDAAENLAVADMAVDAKVVMVVANLAAGVIKVDMDAVNSADAAMAAGLRARSVIGADLASTKMIIAKITVAVTVLATVVKAGVEKCAAARGIGKLVVDAAMAAVKDVVSTGEEVRVNIAAAKDIRAGKVTRVVLVGDTKTIMT
jgi:hypothetical protein